MSVFVSMCGRLATKEAIPGFIFVWVRFTKKERGWEWSILDSSYKLDNSGIFFFRSDFSSFFLGMFLASLLGMWCGIVGYASGIITSLSDVLPSVTATYSSFRSLWHRCRVLNIVFECYDGNICVCSVVFEPSDIVFGTRYNFSGIWKSGIFENWWQIFM